MSPNVPSFLEPHCPHCHSRHLLPLSNKTLIGAGMGAGLGGVLAWLGTVKDPPTLEVQDIPAILAGALTGALAGAALGSETAGSMIQDYLCLSCFHHFTWIRGAHND